MRVALLTAQVPFVFGGAEYLTRNLEQAIRDAGHQVEIVAVPFKWYPPAAMVDHTLAARLLDVSESAGVPIDRAIGLKFPAWLVRHPNKVMWVIHQHRSAYDLWDRQMGDFRGSEDGTEMRRFVEASDTMVFDEAKTVFTISANVSKRLKHYSGVESTPLYSPPDDAELFRCDGYEPFLFFPSRLNPLKRQELVLEALPLTRQPVSVVFAGSADDPAYGAKLAEKARSLGVADRVRWAGGVGNDEKIALYATCLGVVFPPVDEDYGYVTLEAMLAHKAVVTCTDSGGPLEFIRNGDNGLVAEPTAPALAEAMDMLWARPDLAKLWGGASREIYNDMKIGWPHVVEALLS